MNVPIICFHHNTKNEIDKEFIAKCPHCKTPLKNGVAQFSWCDICVIACPNCENFLGVFR